MMRLGYGMWAKFKKSSLGGATVEYALFLAALSVLVLSGVVILGDQFKPQIVAWRDGVQVDQTLTGSIKKVEDKEEAKTYRVFRLPEGLKNPDQ